jgi:hypothetical protein
MSCCENWDKAFKEETDNEGYGPLMYWGDPDEFPDSVVGLGFHIGYGLERIRFCPWCGRAVYHIKPEDQ